MSGDLRSQIAIQTSDSKNSGNPIQADDPSQQQAIQQSAISNHEDRSAISNPHSAFSNHEDHSAIRNQHSAIMKAIQQS